MKMKRIYPGKPTDRHACFLRKFTQKVTLTSLVGIFLTLVVSLVLCPDCQAAGKTKPLTVTVIGSSPASAKNLPKSRQEAVADGLEEAVDQALGKLLPPETIIAKFQLIGESLLSKTETFILGYKVLAEAVHDKHYRVVVQATVSMERIREHLANLGLMLGSMPYPRVLVVLSEQQPGNLEQKTWWSGSQDKTVVSGNTLVRQLASAGFIIIRAPENKLEEQSAEKPTVDQVLALGRKLNADVVVFGSATAQESTNTMGESIRSFNALVKLTAFKVDSSLKIASSEQTGVAVYTDTAEGCRRALATAARQAAEELASQIADHWKKQTQASAAIKVLVTGTGGQIANFVRFRGVLGTLSGVDGVRLNQIMPDQAELEVNYQGDARSLAEALLLKQFGNFGINIYEIGENEIRLNLVAR